MELRSLAIAFLFCWVTATGVAQTTSAQGEVDVNQVDDQGRKQGKWQKKYADGTWRYQGQFKDDKPVGDFTYFYANGAFSAVLTYDAALGDTVKARHYHERGTMKGEGFYVDKKRVGLWKFYDFEEILSAEEHYKDGKKHGNTRVYFFTGTLAAEQGWKMDVKHGVWKEYYADGQVKYDEVYVDGNLDGAVKHYYENGKPKTAGQYADAVKDGKWVYYNDNGAIAAQELYDKGKLLKQMLSDESKELKEKADKERLERFKEDEQEREDSRGDEWRD